MSYKIVIAGGRTFTKYALLQKTMCEKIRTLSKQGIDDIEIVSGGAIGADKLGELFAKKWALGLKVFPADWGMHGKSAGAIRNMQMAKYCDEAVVFWDGKSKGSHNMINCMNDIKKPVMVVMYSKE